MEFLELAKARARIRESTLNHVESVLYFKSEFEESFLKSEVDVITGEHPDGELHGITTTLTCVESLFAAGDEGAKAGKEILDHFAPRALSRPSDWKSEGAALVYCRVRALAPLLELRSPASDDERGAITRLLTQAWRRVRAKYDEDGLFEIANSGSRSTNYPPNAYLTYFGLAALENAPSAIPNEAQRQFLAIEWLERCLAEQVTLHFQDASYADPQQLLWALCGLVRFRPEVLVERSRPSFELVRAGLRAFFAQQLDGTWRRGEPLFHYPEAGNAYSYPFETLGELLVLATKETTSSRELRRLLFPYAKEIVISFEHLMETRRALPISRGFGWCSGHHPHRTSPESWATACVYRLLQAARRLFGVWTRDLAAELLGARQATGGLETMNREGDSWDAGYGSAGSQLSTLFIQPILGRRLRPQVYDPDGFVLDSAQARSAILFGPPGTGKTKLVEAIAACLNWPIIEITPAVFLDKGVELVSARADEVFRQLMELDECVILFDEIDELIRSRDPSSEPLERFFTTTMLPRLSKLWEQRKVLFFVNTNGISQVDSAIRRSSRFDAALFVLPPSFHSKAAVLRKHGVEVGFTLEEVQTALGSTVPAPENSSAVDPDDLCWFGLLRHDQTERLAARVGAVTWDHPISGAELIPYLKDFASELTSADWKDYRADLGQTTRPGALAAYKNLLGEQRFDHGRLRVVRASEGMDPPVGAHPLLNEMDEASPYWQIDLLDSKVQVWAADSQLSLDGSGQVSLQGSGQVNEV